MSRRYMDCQPSDLDAKNISETLMRWILWIASLIKSENAKEAVQKRFFIFAQPLLFGICSYRRDSLTNPFEF